MTLLEDLESELQVRIDQGLDIAKLPLVIAEIRRLNELNKDLIHSSATMRSTMLIELHQLRHENESFRKALEFYADARNFENNDTLEIAREALGIKE